MSIQVQYRRGSAAQNDVFTGALAEITVDTTNKTIRVHDGATAGGSNIATVAYVDNAIGSLSANSITDGTSNVRIAGANGNVLVGVDGNANVGVFTASGLIVTGSIEATNGFIGLDATAIANGSANVRTFQNANVAISAGGNANVLTVTGTGADVLGTLNASGNANVGNLGATTVVATTLTGTLSTAAQTNITSVGTLTALAVTGNASAGNFVGTLNGSGANVTNINASNISSGTLSQDRLANAAVTLGSTALTLGATVTSVTGLSSVTSTSFVGALTGAATTAGTVTTAAQPNITSVGTLSSLAVTGNTTSGNLLTGGLMSATGGITGASFTGNGRPLTSLNAANIDTGTLPAARLSGTYTITVSGAATTAGTVTTAAQPNITSVGTLSSLAVTGNTTSGNLLTGGLISATGQITGSQFNGSGAGLTSIPGGNVTGTVANATYATSAGTASTATSATTAGTVTTAAQPNITSVGTLTSVSVSGNVTAGNVSGTTGAFTTVTGNGRALTSLNATNLDTGTVPSARLSGTYTITVSGAATTAGTVTTAAQPNITSVGTLTALTVTGNITGGNLITAGLASVSSIVKTGTNAVGNIGQTTNRFNNVFARASSASYADLAEIYLTDSDYPAGTVVVFGGAKEVTESTEYADSRLAGVISTNPAFVMNDDAPGQPIALQGRVPCSVVGNIVPGDLITTSNVPGVATRLDPNDWRPGAVLGKALTGYNNVVPGVIEVVVGRV